MNAILWVLPGVQASPAIAGTVTSKALVNTAADATQILPTRDERMAFLLPCFGYR
jgi:hypothetical protein